MRIPGKLILWLIVSISLCNGKPISYMQDYRGEINSLLDKLLSVETPNGDYTLIQKPSSGTQRQVRNRLLQIAHESLPSRLQVVEFLIRIVARPVSEEEAGTDYRWTMAVDVLGELRATESIDVLVKNLDQTGQNSGVSLHYRPVVKALAKMGWPALPRLIEALADKNQKIRREAAGALAEIGQPAMPWLRAAIQSKDVKTKGGAALALAWLGGAEAKSAIEGAIKTETDPEALSALQEALKEMQRRRGN